MTDKKLPLIPTTQVVPVLVDQLEAARILCVSHKWLERDRWAEKKIPYVKLGRGVRYRIDDLMAYIDKNRQVA